MDAKITISPVGPNIHSKNMIDYQVKVENIEKASNDFFITQAVDFLDMNDDYIVREVVKSNKTASKIVSDAINDESAIKLNDLDLDCVFISMKLPFLRSKQPWDNSEKNSEGIKFY
jgi:hypothetical protein